MPSLTSAILLSAVIAAPGAEVAITTDRDNTLYFDADGAISNGAGPHMFTGTNGAGQPRRAVLRFDIADAVPPGSVIEAVDLTLHLSQTSNLDQAVGLHRLLADWGEGASAAGGGGGGGGGAEAEAGDATWLHTFYDTKLWKTPGGDLAGTASGTATIGGPDTFGPHTWPSTPEMVGDVQGWLDDPASSHGWALVGNEAVPQTSKRFGTREHPSAEERPRLLILYTPPLVDGDVDGDGWVDVEDLILVILGWGPCDDPCAADLDGSGDVGCGDLVTVLDGWSGD